MNTDAKHGPCVVFCTCPDQAVARHIATSLLEQSLAACVNIVANVESVYRWQGEMQCDSEILILIKSRFELFETLEQQLQSLHPYELPEIIAVPIQTGSKQYLEWIEHSTRE